MNTMRTLSKLFFLLCLTASINLVSVMSYAQSPNDPFKTLIESVRKRDIDKAIDDIKQNWHPGFTVQILELLSLTRDYYTSKHLLDILHEKTGQSFGYDLNEWFYWLWNQPEMLTSHYADYKAALYQNIDPKFHRYFDKRQEQRLIRLDEIRWGGVVQDGIPPLRQPNMISADQADYLASDNVVFGIEINGDARAYPKRILAWHEMFVDEIGGVNIAGVYCTLCGTVIPYKTTIGDKNYELGTSGFLYRSNKLMYDAQTQSMWNTLTGEPVVGPLVNQGIKLEHLSVVTTTWGEWKRRHPDTQVLSLKTGHSRDYGEGVAYQDYFATDRLMFNTPFNDTRLNNKQEVLALRFAGAPKDQVAIDTKLLQQMPLFTTRVGRQKVLVLTDKTGANRVYDPKNIEFVSYDQDQTVIDSRGFKWTLDESTLRSQNNDLTLTRLPYHRAFWFGWHAAYPDTKLIQ